MGKEVASNAIREAIVTDRFQHPNIIKIVVKKKKKKTLQKLYILKWFNRICA